MIFSRTHPKCREQYLFLDSGDLDPNYFYQAVVGLEKKFTASRIIQDNYETSTDELIRCSTTLNDRYLVDALAEPIRSLVAKNHELILSQLGIEPFTPGITQVSCVAFCDGDFFKAHKDGLDNMIHRRRYTWVYYFHRNPQAFNRGELLFYDQDQVSAEIKPESGALIVFPADVVHEVTAVEVPSKSFLDARFTITGFVCKKATITHRIKSKIARTCRSRLARLSR